MAPIIPFVTEEIWQNAIRPLDPESAISVHLSDWPLSLPTGRKQSLLEQTDVVRGVISIAHRLRSQEQLKVRQPLSCLYIVADKDKQVAIQKMSDIISEEVNVKSIRILQNATELEKHFLTLDLQRAGPVLKKDVQRVKDLLAGLQEEAMTRAFAQFQTNANIDIPGWPEPLPPSLFIEKSQPKAGLVSASENGIQVALDTNITDSLIQEGMARDLVRQLQVLRKESGLQVEQRITITIQTISPDVQNAVRRHEKYIVDETLADRIEVSSVEVPSATNVEIYGNPVAITISAVAKGGVVP